MSHALTPNPRGTPGQNPPSSSGFQREDLSESSNPLVSVYRWRQAPKGLATRRQLRERRLRPGGQDPVAVIECRGGKRKAWLYEIAKAKPIRPMTFAKELALDKAMAKRQTCPSCSRRYYHCLPLKTLGSCLECYDGTPARSDSYMHSSSGQLAAAA